MTAPISRDANSGAPSLSVEVIRDREGLSGLGPVWNDVLDRSELRSPFMRWEWVSAWVDTIGRDVDPFVIVVREAGQVVGLAPLGRCGDGTTRFLGVPQSDYAGLLAPADRPDVVDAMVGVLAVRGKETGPVVLDEMPDDTSGWHRLVDALRRRSLPVRVEEAGVCLLMPLDDPEASRKRYHKKNIKNYVNWFQKRGELGFRYAGGREAALELLDDLFEQHVERWNETPFPSAFRDEPVRAFYRRFVYDLHPEGVVRLCALDLDDEHLALYLYLVDHEVAYMYKPTFNIEHRAHSPGQVILRFILDHHLDGESPTELRALDYGRGDEGYKNRFATTPRVSWRVVIYRSRIAALAAEARHRLRQSVVVEKLLEWGILRRRG